MPNKTDIKQQHKLGQKFNLLSSERIKTESEKEK